MEMYCVVDEGLRFGLGIWTQACQHELENSHGHGGC